MAKSISVAVGDSETMRWGPWIAAAVEVAEVGVELLPLPHAVASSTSQTSTKDRRSTFPPSARGTDWRRTAGLLTRGSPYGHLPGPRASGSSAGEHLPSQRRGRGGLLPASPTARLCVWREPTNVQG